MSADALLPGGPYDLWRPGETARRIKDLVGAFAQVPKLPKMLRRGEILETLVEGARQGFFVLRQMRPDKSFRTVWRQEVSSDDIEKDPTWEVVLPEAAQLDEISPGTADARGIAGTLAGDETDHGERTAVHRLLGRQGCEREADFCRWQCLRWSR